MLYLDYVNGEWKLIETLRLIFTDLASNPKRLREKKEQYGKCIIPGHFWVLVSWTETCLLLKCDQLMV